MKFKYTIKILKNIKGEIDIHINTVYLIYSTTSAMNSVISTLNFLSSRRWTYEIWPSNKEKKSTLMISDSAQTLVDHQWVSSLNFFSFLKSNKNILLKTEQGDSTSNT